MKLKIIGFGLLLLFALTNAWSDNRYISETYKLIIPPQPTQTGDKIEVVEIFWYGCPHCYDLEPYLEKWLETKPEDVEFVRVPGILGKGWLSHAKAFYTAEKLGVLDQVHRPLFDAIHKEGEHIVDEDRLRKFFASKGVDEDEFTEIFNSEAINDKIKQAFIIGKNYQITGVPTILVNGKYKTTASMSGGNAGIIDTINELTSKERSQNTASN